jgi:hypothetical protein
MLTIAYLAYFPSMLCHGVPPLRVWNFSGSLTGKYFMDGMTSHPIGMIIC